MPEDGKVVGSVDVGSRDKGIQEGDPAGASDRKTKESSTFMFRMSDGSCIVKAASRKSSGDAADRYSSVNTSDDSEYGGVYEGHLPIIGYIKATEPCVVVVYSLKNETAINVWRFSYAVLKFQTNISNPENKAVVLMADGTV